MLEDLVDWEVWVGWLLKLGLLGIQSWQLKPIICIGVKQRGGTSMNIPGYLML